MYQWINKLFEFHSMINPAYSIPILTDKFFSNQSVLHIPLNLFFLYLDNIIKYRKYFYQLTGYFGIQIFCNLNCSVFIKLNHKLRSLWLSKISIESLLLPWGEYSIFQFNAEVASTKFIAYRFRFLKTIYNRFFLRSTFLLWVFY